MRNKRTLIIVMTLALAGLSILTTILLDDETGSPFFSKYPPGLRFERVDSELGIDFRHETGARGERLMPETVIGAAGWIDHDADGLLDLYLVNGADLENPGGAGGPRNQLYRNLGGKGFEEVGAAAGVADAGYGTGLAVGDYDNDGLSDLFVTNYGANVLYHNEGDGRFRDVTVAAGVGGGAWSSAAVFIDCDRDGHLDLYVCNYVRYEPGRRCSQGELPVYCSPGEFEGAPDELWRNRGDGTFKDVSFSSGIALGKIDSGKSLGVVPLDYDDDGDSDIYVACDQVPNLLFRNDGDFNFSEVGLIADVAYSSGGVSQAGMGVDAGDVDLDGRQDLVVTNFSREPNALYLNRGGGLFSDASAIFGLAAASLPPLGFGVVLCDFDLDSDLDLYVANGHVLDNVAELGFPSGFAQPDQLFENNDGLGFKEVSSQAGAWFGRAAVGRAVAVADFDGDGDDDLAVVNNGEGVALLRNQSATGHWIAFHLQGVRSNRDGYGARVKVEATREAGAFVRRFECRSTRSYAAACDPRVRVGLGSGPVRIDRVEVSWPSGIRQVLSGLEIDRWHHVVETGGGR